MTNGYRNIHALPNGYRLHWYEIDGILGQGGFGITYLAHDINLNQRVAIKEYLPVDVAGRIENNEIQPVSGGEQADTYQWGLNRFIKDEPRRDSRRLISLSQAAMADPCSV